MTIGGSIALIVIGAILRWAINWSSALVNLRLVGLILMIGGVIGLVISLAWMFARRRPAAGPPVDPVPDPRYDEPVGYERRPVEYREERYVERPVYRDEGPGGRPTYRDGR
jgi:hypothetical protein